MIATLLMLIAANAWAGPKLPDVAFEDLSAGRTRKLSELSGLPIVMLPIFTHCAAICPRTAAALKTALLGTQDDVRSYQVFIFSFDDADTAADLLQFGRKLNLPASWILAHLDHESIYKLLDAMDYRISRQGHAWVHPNIVNLLSPDLRLVKSISGASFTPAQLHQGLEVARGSIDRLYRYGPYLSAFAMLGVIFSVVFFVHLLLKLPRSVDSIS